METILVWTVIFKCRWRGKRKKKQNSPITAFHFLTFLVFCWLTVSTSPLSLALTSTVIPFIFLHPDFSLHFLFLHFFSLLCFLPSQPIFTGSSISLFIFVCPAILSAAPGLRHMALSFLPLSSINTVVSGNYRHIAQHARLRCGFWCSTQNKAGKDKRSGIWSTALHNIIIKSRVQL